MREELARILEYAGQEGILGESSGIVGRVHGAKNTQESFWMRFLRVFNTVLFGMAARYDSLYSSLV